MGYEGPALFGSLQSLRRGKSPETKLWRLLGAQVTLINKMSLFKSQAQISLLVFFQRVGDGAFISRQQPLRTLCPMLNIKGTFLPPGCGTQPSCEWTQLQLHSSSQVIFSIKWKCPFKSLSWTGCRLNESTDQTFLTGGSGNSSYLLHLVCRNKEYLRRD